MAKELTSLAKDTAIYGLSSIIGKFLNWLLVPLYTFVLAQSSDYGIVTNLYSWTALLVVILTYGMETGFLRFANKKELSVNSTYTTALTSIGTTSTVFAVVCVAFDQPIASLLGYPDHSEFISMLAIVIAMDTFASIPFTYLRFKGQAFRFAMLKMTYVILNIFFNIFFLALCPKIMSWRPELISWFYNPDYGVGYVFVANILSTTIQTLFLLPTIFAEKYKFDGALLKQMLRYSLPLLVLGIAGIMNQTVDKIIFPFLFDDKVLASSELGIYGACFKIAMVMMMFTQAFRYAYEPFVFAKHKDKESVGAYADAMKFFVIFSWLIFLGITFYLDIFKLIIRSDYWEGLKVVPIVLCSYIFQGIYFNLSIWYKLTDKTKYGAYFSIIGLIITLIINILFVPKISYMASAMASLVCYFIIMIISYVIGQKYLKIPYDLRSIVLYSLVAIVMYAGSLILHFEAEWLNYIYKTALLVVFLAIIFKRDLPISGLPFIGKYLKK